MSGVIGQEKAAVDSQPRHLSPGPWETSGIRISGYGLENERFLTVHGPKGIVAYIPYTDRPTIEHYASHADQRLIAAARDLLAAAKATLAARDGKASMDAIIALRDAIAKAEGRS